VVRHRRQAIRHDGAEGERSNGREPDGSHGIPL
jgi:hypothetical protein